jgi:hypothetical protein
MEIFSDGWGRQIQYGEPPDGEGEVLLRRLAVLDQLQEIGRAMALVDVVDDRLEQLDNELSALFVVGLQGKVVVDAEGVPDVTDEIRGVALAEQITASRTQLNAAEEASEAAWALLTELVGQLVSK